MKLKHIFLSFLFLSTWKHAEIRWLTQQHANYLLHYTEADTNNIPAYSVMLDKGIHSVSEFFQAGFQKKFDVFVYPKRSDLDSQWQKDWSMPQFKSECWMVASGVASKLDVISPAKWTSEACEHDYADTVKTQKLITHELVHVFHGQLNASPDFSDISGIDWFVEGIATYAAGQCDAERITQVKNAIAANEIPKGLDDFWTGKLKYGLSGSVVMYIDKKFGREKLKQLLAFNRKDQILSSLGISESELLDGWKDFMKRV